MDKNYSIPVQMIGILIIFTTLCRPTYYGGIYLLWSMGTKLHPHQPKIHADINCKLSGNPSPMTLFAFRTHAHKHGTVITGYKVDKNGKIQEIARGDPQKPQMFYPMQKFVVVDNGDVLHARCTFNTTEEDRIVNIGIFTDTILFSSTH